MPVKSTNTPRRRIPLLSEAAATSTTPPVQVGDALTFTVPGGASTPDPGDGIWATWPLLDVLGRRCKTGTVQPFDVFQALLWLQEITPPALTANAYIAAGIITGSNLAGAINGYYGGIVYAGSIRTARAGVLATGTATNTDDASPQGDLRQVMIDNAYSFGGQLSTVQVVGLNSAGENIFGNFDTVSRAAAAALGAAGADPHLFIAAGRTANTAGAIDVTARLVYSALDMGKLPTIP